MSLLQYQGGMGSVNEYRGKGSLLQYRGMRERVTIAVPGGRGH